ncbi:MAG TPA: phage virion morphogenesis protein [bacterium]|nr:phage virion morphogenesis protein [bacterium]
MADDKFIKLTVSDDITKHIKGLAERLEDLEPVLRGVAGIMHDDVERNFKDEGRPDKWKGLSKKTEAMREKRGHWPGKILQESGALAASIQEDADRTQAMVGTNLAYAAIHHFGFNGTVKVRGSTRKVGSRDQYGKIDGSRRKTASGVAFVKPHSRKMVMEARPFLLVTDGGQSKIFDHVAVELGKAVSAN